MAEQTPPRTYETPPTDRPITEAEAARTAGLAHNEHLKIASGYLRGTLAEIRRIIAASALRVMGPDETLVVDVLDIDRAGFVRPDLNIPSGLRIVSDATPPAIRLRYELRRGGRRIAGGEERLTDINFLFGARAVAATGSFGYEEALLRDWARRRLSVRAGARGSTFD